MIEQIADAIILKEKLSFHSDKYFNWDGAKHPVKVLPTKILTDRILAQAMGNHFHSLLKKDSDKPGYIENYKIKLTQEILTKLKDKKVEDVQESMGMSVGDIDRKRSFRYKSLCLVTDVVSGEEVLFDRETGRCVEFDVDTWKSLLPKDATLREAILQHNMLGRIEYNPYSLTPHRPIVFHGQDVYEFNSHIVPAWRHKEIVTPVMPELVTRFLTHLVPDDECRAFVINWLHLMLTSRCQTYLTLNSVMGTGKGRLAGLAQALVGASNYAEASQGFLESRFNYIMRNKRCFVLDETPITEKNSNILRLIINNTITLEGKGIEADKPFTNFASMIVSNNYDFNVFLNRMDRRFSVPELTDVPLLKVMAQEDIDELSLKMETDVEFMANFGHWILKYGRDTKWDEFSAWKKQKFYFLVENSLHEWQKFLVEKIKTKQFTEISFEDLIYEYQEIQGKTFPGRSKVEAFLLTYADRYGNSYGRLEEKGGKRSIIVGSKYAKQDFPDEDDI